MENAISFSVLISKECLSKDFYLNFIQFLDKLPSIISPARLGDIQPLKEYSEINFEEFFLKWKTSCHWRAKSGAYGLIAFGSSEKSRNTLINIVIPSKRISLDECLLIKDLLINLGNVVYMTIHVPNEVDIALFGTSNTNIMPAFIKGYKYATINSQVSLMQGLRNIFWYNYFGKAFYKIFDMKKITLSNFPEIRISEDWQFEILLSDNFNDCIDKSTEINEKRVRFTRLIGEKFFSHFKERNQIIVPQFIVTADT